MDTGAVGKWFWLVIMMMSLMGVLTVMCSSTSGDGDGVGANNKAAAAQATALFVFGDSLVDNGNNNFLNSIAKSNYYPYGVDSNRGPTGRFSNGDTFVDYLGIHLYVY